MNELTGSLVDSRLSHLERKLAKGNVTQNEIMHFLVTHYYDPIYRLAMSFVHQKDESADIAQKTLIKAANKIDQYRPGTNFKAWVFRIGINEAKNTLRRRKLQDKLKSILTLSFYATPQPLAPEAQVLRNERDQLLWEAVSQLPEKQMLPVLLRYNFDLTDLEIAEALEIPHGTVRSRLHSAHKKLYGLLNQSRCTGSTEVKKQ